MTSPPVRERAGNGGHTFPQEAEPAATRILPGTARCPIRETTLENAQIRDTSS